MKIDRLVSIIMILLDHKRVSAQELADRFEVSLRTIYRDLDAISLAGIPITASPGVNGGYEIMPQYKADKKTFSADELSALVMGLSSLSSLMRKENLIHAFAKVNSFIPPEQAEMIREKTEQFCFDWSPWSGSIHIQPIFETIRYALDAKILLSFDYISTKSKASSRIAEPYQLVLKGNHWYLYAFCRERQDYRLFRLARMRNLTAIQESYTPRDFPKPQLEFEKILSSIQTDIQLRIHPSILDRILEYCSFDRISPEGDGFLVRFPFVENDYYYDMLLGFGTRCECLGPEKVRNEIKRRINRLVDIYE